MRGLMSSIRTVKGRATHVVWLSFLDHETGIAVAEKMYLPPDGLLVGGQGNVQTLVNGNVLVGWGVRGAVTEFCSDGTPIFHAYLDAENGESVQSYRSFRCEWEGRPREKPALVAVRRMDGGIMAWVSWNSDTVTKGWQLFGRGTKDDRLLQTVPRQGFKPRLEVDSHQAAECGVALGQRVFVVAVDDDGKELARSATAEIWDEDREKQYGLDNTFDIPTAIPSTQ